ncbi:hypothetical protein F4703DRAFT_1799139 [Phycomyces blakesleeanus]|uniref:Uncharacterized protein n=1 Tax=Phycomyces blakesleeanus (strain ATCC 8743b / DSM 1359 / FGSC 10004 / NBRC 33097 / NRRL 1555) TaxID=763407 RepID=A0A167M3N7_PHYB8|nr:hypothetical protein PHYBLDRAFT_170354 [Phycomyces blakesleeanus NRRL 1555(-)]OAD71694.1 hypothetical protein PHYBLDRAFT_170354 [Phycomyces blakesleeanus NRRL 1555(-)]|eukprot:XP_018289734.1 hypothetical protein PHYBLDRAFT_170354 [Phycomyces blakesleeanus NRRL 1555(-)]
MNRSSLYFTTLFGILAQNYLNFISEALRVLWLLFLGLEYVKFDGSELMKSVKIFIETSHSQLDTLILCSILSYCGLIKHYSTKQHINGNLNQLNLNNQEHPTLSKRYRICFNKTNKIDRSLAWELGRRDIECPQKFCKRFMNNDSPAYNTVFTKTWVALVGFFFKRKFFKNLRSLESGIVFGVFVIQFKFVVCYCIGKEELYAKYYGDFGYLEDFNLLLESS